MEKNAKILITGASGMVGSQLVKQLIELGYKNLLTPSSKDIDLRDIYGTNLYFINNKPEYVFHLAAKVGGIQANIDSPVQFLNDNLMMNTNIFYCCNLYNVKKVLYLGSSCIYPKECQQPMKEEYLLTGLLEPTNEGYALAKIAGLKLSEAYFKQFGLKTVCLMPCNIYGTGDHYDSENSHVLSALISKINLAKVHDLPFISLWGTGIARREFIHVSDVVKAILYFFDKIETPEIINIGTGLDCTIKELAEMIKKEIGYTGEIRWDETKPNGMLRKCLDVSKMKSYKFYPYTNLDQGIKRSIKEYKGRLV